MQTIRIFAIGYIGRSIGRRRRCVARKDMLLINCDYKVFLSDYILQDYVKLFDEAGRGSPAVSTEFCFA